MPAFNAWMRIHTTTHPGLQVLILQGLWRSPTGSNILGMGCLCTTAAGGPRFLDQCTAKNPQHALFKKRVSPMSLGPVILNENTMGSLDVWKSLQLSFPAAVTCSSILDRNPITDAKITEKRQHESNWWEGRHKKPEIQKQYPTTNISIPAV